ncbi:MAG: four helix bundle protein [Bacillota bacterium]
MGYDKLEVYQKSYKLCLEIHKLTMSFPKHELYEIGSQFRRAAVSIPLNIAEGYGRREYSKDFKKFLITAKASSNEVIVLLNMVRDLGYITEEGFEMLLVEFKHLERQLSKLIQTIRN